MNTEITITYVVNVDLPLLVDDVLITNTLQTFTHTYRLDGILIGIV